MVFKSSIFSSIVEIQFPQFGPYYCRDQVNLLFWYTLVLNFYFISTFFLHQIFCADRNYLFQKQPSRRVLQNTSSTVKVKNLNTIHSFFLKEPVKMDPKLAVPKIFMIFRAYCF